MAASSFFIKAVQDDDDIIGTGIKKDNRLGERSLIRDFFSGPADFSEKYIEKWFCGGCLRNVSCGFGMLLGIFGASTFGIALYYNGFLQPDNIAKLFGLSGFGLIGSAGCVLLSKCVFEKCKPKKNPMKELVGVAKKFTKMHTTCPCTAPQLRMIRDSVSSRADLKEE
jgi:hypothetical protein